jgi:biotin carboxyl carrier protein
MNAKSKKLIPVAIIGSLLLIAVLIKMNPPEATQRRPSTGPQMVVEIEPVKYQDYLVKLQSYGSVQPRTQSVLVAQVGGQIISINENVRDGGFFEKGDVLGQIDPRDYEADVSISEASLADARQALAEAEARSVQALEDWERLGNTGDAPDLVLRVPQLEAASARVKSAESALQKANLDLERTQLVAPFAGRVLRKLVDVGQVVSNNTQVAEIYATDVVEIRLPIRNRDLGFIDLPESFRFSESVDASTRDVIIRSDLIGGKDIVIAWQNDDDAIISDGLADGDQLVTTPLGQVTSGIRVAIAGQERKNAGGPPGSQGQRPGGDGESRPRAATDRTSQ